MIRKIVKDTLFLRQKSERATKEDVQIIEDLRDTLKANSDRCVGMAANMIGYKKNIIIVSMGMVDVLMLNPIIKTKSKPYNTEEGCLSLDGVRSTLRYDEIEVEYEDVNFKKKTNKYSGFIAQIIHHELDHLDGILI